MRTGATLSTQVGTTMTERRRAKAGLSYPAALSAWRRQPLLACVGLLISVLLCAGCAPDPPPPPPARFGGLPVSGSLGTALNSGFTACVNVDAISLRCRRHGVKLLGQGPFEAALDLRGSKGQSGFSNLTLWHDEDQRALYQVLPPLMKGGWRFCYTGTERAGDQAVFTHPDRPFSVYMDISYWGKRRIRVFPNSGAPRLSGPCTPSKTLSLFNMSID